jgi:hypothetical protein
MNEYCRKYILYVMKQFSGSYFMSIADFFSSLTTGVSKALAWLDPWDIVQSVPSTRVG